MTVKLLTEHHVGFLNLKQEAADSSESTLVKMPHCWKSHVAAHLIHFSGIHIYLFIRLLIFINLIVYLFVYFFFFIHLIFIYLFIYSFFDSEIVLFMLLSVLL